MTSARGEVDSRQLKVDSEEKERGLEVREGGVPEWEEYPHTPGVFVRVANKGVAGYGTWKSVRRMEDESTTETERRRAEEERGWLVSNKWLTIVTTPLPCFSKVIDSKGTLSCFRINTCRSVDSAWFSGALSLVKSNS